MFSENEIRSTSYFFEIMYKLSSTEKKSLLHLPGLLHAKMEIIFQDIETFLENAKQVRPKEVPKKVHGNYRSSFRL